VNRLARGKRRRLSDSSKRFTAEKKVCFSEDDNEEFSVNEDGVKTVESSVLGSVLDSPSHIRSGREFCLGLCIRGNARLSGCEEEIFRVGLVLIVLKSYMFFAVVVSLVGANCVM
jgi:hypothetical protein